MALNNSQAKSTAGGAPAGGAPAGAGANRGKKTDANEQILAQGAEIVAAMSEEARAALGSKSSTLHFVRLLGLQSKKSSRRVNKNQSQDCSTPVGVVLRTDEAISVPVIDITKDKDTGIDPATDITYRDVAAGEEFVLSYYEFMYLIIREEYAGFCSNGEDPKGVYFSPKLPAFFKGTAKLPTPTINFRVGSVKASMFDIDEKNAANQWEIKEPYREKFGALIRKTTPSRSSGAKSTTPAPTMVSLALKKILGV